MFFFIVLYRNISKKAAKLISNSDESDLIMCDKTGDVYTLNIDNMEKNEFELSMGHMSMLIDMVFNYSFFKLIF